jgi:hypothetical protein
MKIGDSVTYEGRRYGVLGFDPMGVDDPCAYLEDQQTGERIKVAIPELEPVTGDADVIPVAPPAPEPHPA